MRNHTKIFLFNRLVEWHQIVESVSTSSPKTQMDILKNVMEINIWH